MGAVQMLVDSSVTVQGDVDHSPLWHHRHLNLRTCKGQTTLSPTQGTTKGSRTTAAGRDSVTAPHLAAGRRHHRVSYRPQASIPRPDQSSPGGSK